MRFRFRGVAGQAQWWLVMSSEGTDLCDFDPGHPVSGTVEAELGCLTRVWRGDLSWRAAVASGDLEVVGPAAVRRAVPTWLNLSAYATVPRPGFEDSDNAVRREPGR